MRGIVASTLLVALLGLSQMVLAAGNPELGQKKAAACMACHGPDGNSAIPPPPTEPWPKLAGQEPDYIAKQLGDFKAKKRINAQMSPMADTVAAADIPDLAAFFSSQKVKPNQAGSPDNLALGEKLFTKGKGKGNFVPACMGCHGISGGGSSNWNVKGTTLHAPAISSQHANYVAKQLKAFRDGSRSNDTAAVMRSVAKQLDDKDIAAVADYIASLAR